MSKFSKSFYRFFAFFGLCLILTVTLFATGTIEMPVFLDIYKDKNYEEITSNDKNNSTPSYSGNSSDGSITITTANGYVDANSVPSALKIKLSGDYLTAFQKASSSLSKNDTRSLILIKVGLQILQSKTIKYELATHYYSLDYTYSGTSAGVKFYNLKDCINRINSGTFFYTDCFGFVRLTHSIACYTLDNNNPATVAGINGLYGWRGSYSNGKKIDSMKNVKTGAVIYDTLTAPAGRTGRHVAMYLFTQGSNIYYMDQGGIKKGIYKSNGYITTAGSNPYKFDKFKNYNL